jgi:hypothetical protein
MTPNPTVEIAPGFTWQSDPGTISWVDVTDSAEVAAWSRGRSNELELYSAGTCTITLADTERAFDPSNAAGPYAGELVPGVPVRVTCDGEGLFYGYADGFRYRPGTHRGVTVMPCTDVFGRLNGRLRGTYEREVLADAPWAYYPLGDGGAVAVDASGNRRDGDYVGEVSGATAGRAFGRASAFAETPGNAAILSATPTNPRIEAWFRYPEPRTVGQAWIYYESSGATDRPFKVSSGGFVSNRSVATTAATNAADGLWHHIVVNLSTIYVDGVEQPVTSTIGGSPVTTHPPSIGNPDAFTILAADAVELGDVAIYTSDLSAARILAHYNAGAAPYRGTFTGEVIDAVCELAGLPAALRNLDTGDVVVGDVDTAGRSVLDLLQTLAETEGGRLFAGRDGRLTFHAASRTFTGDSVYTFTDDGTGTGLLESSLELVIDDAFTFDGAEIARVDGVPQYAGATDASNVYARTDLLMASDALARARAERTVGRYATPRVRAEDWTIQPDNDPSSWPTILALELGDVVTLEVTPLGDGDPITVELFVERLEHDPEPGDWTITLAGSPTDPRNLFRWAGPNTVGNVNGWDAGLWR